MTSSLQSQPVNRIGVQIFSSDLDASRHLAVEIAELIHERQSERRLCVLGLATGSTPLAVYAELVRMHREDGLSFENVVTFNLDEYFPMPPGNSQSYVRFMKEHLFDQIDICPSNVHIPDGTLNKGMVDDYCTGYESRIAELGGIDLQVLGIGRTGHIGFNEPGSDRNSATRMVTLNAITREDAAGAFSGIEHVPQHAITMGVRTILNARRIRLLAFGDHKAAIVQRTVEGDVSDERPATFLKDHHDVEFLLDAQASKFVNQSAIKQCP